VSSREFALPDITSLLHVFENADPPANFSRNSAEYRANGCGHAASLMPDVSAILRPVRSNSTIGESSAARLDAPSASSKPAPNRVSFYYRDCSDPMQKVRELSLRSQAESGALKGALRIHVLPGLALGHFSKALTDFSVALPLAAGHDERLREARINHKMSRVGHPALAIFSSSTCFCTEPAYCESTSRETWHLPSG
jgi:hypothetical protein